MQTMLFAARKLFHFVTAADFKYTDKYTLVFMETFLTSTFSAFIVGEYSSPSQISNFAPVSWGIVHGKSRARCVRAFASFLLRGSRRGGGVRTDHSRDVRANGNTATRVRIRFGNGEHEPVRERRAGQNSQHTWCVVFIVARAVWSRLTGWETFCLR
jgi:hypothetical protein